MTMLAFAKADVSIGVHSDKRLQARGSVENMEYYNEIS